MHRTVILEVMYFPSINAVTVVQTASIMLSSERFSSGRFQWQADTCSLQCGCTYYSDLLDAPRFQPSGVRLTKQQNDVDSFAHSIVDDSGQTDNKAYLFSWQHLRQICLRFLIGIWFRHVHLGASIGMPKARTVSYTCVAQRSFNDCFP